jgi:hypothetical protein
VTRAAQLGEDHIVVHQRDQVSVTEFLDAVVEVAARQAVPARATGMSDEVRIDVRAVSVHIPPFPVCLVANGGLPLNDRSVTDHLCRRR